MNQHPRAVREDLESALVNVEEARKLIIEKIDEENKKEEPNQKRLFLLVDWKLALLDVKMSLKNIVADLHKIE